MNAVREAAAAFVAARDRGTFGAENEAFAALRAALALPAEPPAPLDVPPEGLRLTMSMFANRAALEAAAEPPVPAPREIERMSDVGYTHAEMNCVREWGERMEQERDELAERLLRIRRLCQLMLPEKHAHSAIDIIDSAPDCGCVPYEKQCAKHAGQQAPRESEIERDAARQAVIDAAMAWADADHARDMTRNDSAEAGDLRERLINAEIALSESVAALQREE